MAIVRKTLEEIKNTPISQEALDRIDAIKDEDIDFSEIPELTKHDFSRAVRGRFTPPHIRIEADIEADIFEWLQSGHQDYNQRLNHILRHVMMIEKNT
ncbi:hypothetical protein [Acinetobacter puyangensis]|uniref:hypothetical protein n=1 Tax=Acinetobacter puyangensis TaxID=1096779 RepID=UPI003A4DBF43